MEFYFQYCELLSYTLFNVCGSERLATFWNDYLVFWSCLLENYVFGGVLVCGVCMGGFRSFLGLLFVVWEVF